MNLRPGILDAPVPDIGQKLRVRETPQCAFSTNHCQIDSCSHKPFGFERFHEATSIARGCPLPENFSDAVGVLKFMIANFIQESKSLRAQPDSFNDYEYRSQKWSTHSGSAKKTLHFWSWFQCHTVGSVARGQRPSRSAENTEPTDPPFGWQCHLA